MAEVKQKFDLVVVEPFDDYSRGDKITGYMVDAILKDHETRVRRVASEATPVKKEV